MCDKIQGNYNTFPTDNSSKAYFQPIKFFAQLPEIGVEHNDKRQAKTDKPQ